MSELGNLLSEEITQQFSKETKQEQFRLLKTWTSIGYKWMNSARAFLLEGQQIINGAKGQLLVQLKTTFSELSGSKDAIENLNTFFTMYQKQNAITLNMQKLLTEGYQLLNNIGERIRGQELEYHIVLTDTGGAVRSSSVVTSFWLTMEQLLKYYANFSGQRIRAKTGKGIYQELMKDDKSLRTHTWTDKELESFKYFANQAEATKNIKNEGNLVEAFFRFREKFPIGWMPYDNHLYWGGINSAVSNTMAKPDKFIQGGDLGNEQMKVLDATVTNLAILINFMSSFFDVIQRSPINEELLGSKVRSNFQPEYDIMEDQLVPALEELFTPSNLRADITVT